MRRAARIAIAVAALAGLGAAPPDAGCYAGSATEIAALLMLAADGTYEYALTYGALDEQSRGRWEGRGTSIALTSEPVKPPQFRLVDDSPGPKRALRITLDLPGGMQPGYFDAEVMYANGTERTVQISNGMVTLPVAPANPPVSVRLLLGVYGVESDRFVLAGDGQALSFRFEPNDLGKVPFEGFQLPRVPNGMRLQRHDRAITLLRQGDTCP